MSNEPSGNPYIGMPRAERIKRREMMDAADAADAVFENIAAATAMKWGHAILKRNDALGPAFPEIKQQAFPRPSLLARPADLSETQVDGIIDATEKALAKVARR